MRGTALLACLVVGVPIARGAPTSRSAGMLTGADGRVRDRVFKDRLFDALSELKLIAPLSDEQKIAFAQVLMAKSNAYSKQRDQRAVNEQSGQTLTPHCEWLKLAYEAFCKENDRKVGQALGCGDILHEMTGIKDGVPPDPEQRAQIFDVFNFFDEYQTGKISMPNLKHAVEKLGETLPDWEITELIDYIDDDEDGEGNSQEFLEGLLKDVK